MNNFKQVIIGKHGVSDKSNFLWNMIGSGIYSLASMVLSFLTIRIMGENEGGIFSIAITLSQMLVYIAYFEMRTYQVTDSRNEFSFKEYYSSKWITCGMMILISVGYVFLKRYDVHKANIVLLMCIYRSLDGFADVFESQFHKDGRMDIAGKSLTYRTILSVAVYFIFLIFTKSLIYSLSAAIFAGVLGIFLFDIIIYQEFGTITFEFDIKKFGNIIRACFPQFIGGFLWTYILSASRLAVDTVLDASAQAYFQVLFLPVSVINLFSGFLFRPMLIKLTELYSDKDYGSFFKIITKLVAIMLGITIICMAGAYVVGIPVLQLLVNLNLQEYKGLFVFLIAAGGVNAVAFIWYYVLAIFRSQKVIIFGYAFSALLANIISPILVKWKGLLGAGVSFFLVVVVLNVIFISVIVVKYRMLKGKWKNE